MSKKHKEYLVNVGDGTVLPYKYIAMMRRLRGALDDVRAVYGDASLNAILLSYMEPEV